MNGPSPLISCVIPTHARPDFLETALRSVLRQSVPPHEVIVVSDVDDADSDALCRRLGDTTDIPVRFVRNHGRGASSSRNAGAAAAAGALLAFLDDDDYWLDDHLEGTTAALAAERADLGVSWLTMFREGGAAPGLHIPAGLGARDVVADNPGVTGSNIVVTKSAFDSIGGFDPELPVKNDGDFFFRLLASGRTYAVNQRATVMQRKHSSGQLTGRTEFRAAGLDRYLAKHESSMSLADRRLVRLQATRIRYHAAGSTPRKLRYLLLGAWYSSPGTVLGSIRNRRTKSFWITDGFGAPTA